LKISTTQVYAKVGDSILRREIMQLEKKLKN